jgi:hypothetical protein
MIELATLRIRAQVADSCGMLGKMVMHLSDDQLRAFAERGYVVIPNVVSRTVIAGAMQRIDRLIEQARRHRIIAASTTTGSSLQAITTR